MKAAAVVVVVAGIGCGAKPLEPPATPLATRSGSTRPTSLSHHIISPGRLEQAFPRPSLDVSSYLPDPARHGRWPLTVAEHPALEPHFEIAGALAQPGITWLELCERGAQHRNLGAKQDLTRYLAAWCDVATHEFEGALYKLGTLESSAMLTLVVATKFDAANIVVERGDAAEVEQLLRRSNLLEPRIADLTAAAYFEAGHREDAYAMNLLATGLDREPHDNAICERMARGIVDAEPALTGALIQGLKNKARASKSAICLGYAHEVACWHDAATDCADYFDDQHLSSGQVHLFEVYEHWPTTAEPSDAWIEIATLAVEAAPMDQAIRFAVPALEIALRTSACLDTRLQMIEILASRLAVKVDNAGGANVQLVDSLLDWTGSLHTGGAGQSCLDLLAKLPDFSASMK